MTEGRLYFLNKLDPNRPIEEKYVTEIDGIRNSFISQDDAMLYMFDNGIRKYKYLTKEEIEYKDFTKIPTYEFWHILNRVGYVLYDFEPYLDKSGNVKKRRAYVWRFIGFGRSCFAETEEKLKQKVVLLIEKYNKGPEDRGYNRYPYYIKHWRN